MRKIFILVFISVSLFLSVPAHASEYSEVIGELMDLIESRYVGGEVSREELYEAALMGISMTLDDYSGYMSDETYGDFSGEMTGRLFGIGVTMRLGESGEPEITRVLSDSPAEGAGLKRGDIVISVNGVPTKGRMLNETIDEIQNPARRTASLEYTRAGETATVEMVKELIKSHTVYTYPLEEITGEKAEDIRYVNVSIFSETTSTDLKTLIDRFKEEGVKKLILDLRVNIGGRLDVAYDICNMLVPAGPAYHTVDKLGRRVTQFSDLKEPPFEKVAVLVDRNTASAAELLTAAMQDSKTAVVVGETTFGKGVVQSVFMLPTGGAFKLTTEEYFRRGGGKVNGVGVTPDHAVTTLMDDYETPEDLTLLKAVELLQE